MPNDENNNAQNPSMSVIAISSTIGWWCLWNTYGETHTAKVNSSSS